VSSQVSQDFFGGFGFGGATWSKLSQEHVKVVHPGAGRGTGEALQLMGGFGRNDVFF